MGIRTKYKYSRSDVLDYIIAYWEENLRAPSYREIMAATEANSTSTVAKILQDLESEGSIELRERYQVRAIMPTEIGESLRKRR